MKETVQLHLQVVQSNQTRLRFPEVEQLSVVLLDGWMEVESRSSQVEER